uniref:CEP209_CC5 domain-containing protein n=1 Tax=Caenorhabditis tropicalis TaxID=1561998 RepID=A0A1I7TF50_9PELO
MEDLDKVLERSDMLDLQQIGEMLDRLNVAEAQREEVLRSIPVDELQAKLVATENEVLVLEKTNKELLASLTTTRTQLSKIVRDRNLKIKEIEQLEEALERMEINRHAEQQNSHLTASMQILLDELNDQATRWGVEKREMAEREAALRAENESLKAQKEDISNHAKNSERMYLDRLREMTARRTGDNSFLAETDELNRKLKDALDAIEEIEAANVGLSDQLEDAHGKLARIEKLPCELEPCLRKRVDLEYEMDSLRGEIRDLEQIREDLEVQVYQLQEKNTQQTIQFSNEKAKFCHDMERVEEKWNGEVCRLNSLVQGLRLRIAQLESQLVAQISKTADTVGKQDATLKEWDDECADLEDELYNLIGKRKTEAKRMRTLARKNTWLTKSLRRLAEQRRGELKAKSVEIAKLTSLCDLHRMEKTHWMAELRKEVNAWKSETTDRKELEKQVAELRSRIADVEKENIELEEKVESVTIMWRDECDLYERNLEKLRENNKSDVDELRAEKRWMVKEAEERLAKIRQEAGEVQKASEALAKQEMETMRQVMEMEKNETVIAMERKLKVVTEKASREKRDLDATIAHWQNELRNCAESHAVDCAVWLSEIKQLREQNERLKENLGVEELDDAGSLDESEDPEESDDGDKVEEEEEEDKKSENWEMVEDEEEM